MDANEELDFGTAYWIAGSASAGFFGPKGQRSIAQGIALEKPAPFEFA
ncbi:MAG: hypothetical protein KF886_00770 [Candidatus Hydrogenedentes bacterium]|nr:hypothetical protein [Candidatus Hydrogenedentota bacterium]